MQLLTGPRYDRELNVLVFDAETTVQWIEKEGGQAEKDGSPFNPKNRLVSGHWLKIRIDLDNMDTVRRELELIDASRETIVQTSVFHHIEHVNPDDPKALTEALEWADLFVAHNAKFDWQWLRETGFPLPKHVWCTMIGEYILARGERMELSLAETAVRRKVTYKKGDLIDELFNKKKIGFEAMPWDTVLEYAEADVISCAEIFLHQILGLQEEENQSLAGVHDLMNEMLEFLTEIECNGIRIDMDALNEVEQEFLAEKAALEKRMKEIVEEVMGDTPINLNSGIDQTKVIYSRVVVDKKRHVEIFNIGTDANGKPKYPPRMKKTTFTDAVRKTTKVVKKTTMVCCPSCKGSGTYYRLKKDGSRYKNPNKCKSCEGAGVIYQETGQTAGLKLVPAGPRSASIHGFKAGKDEIPILIHQAQEKGNLIAVEFLEKMKRLNAVSSYLSSFVNGIRTWVRPDGILHPNFNQTVAATGRLSSTKPNFQNLPKGGKFPIRRAIISRWEGGLILEADFSGLEFRVAGELSRDTQIMEDILTGKDVHKQTASIINQCSVSEVDKDTRQGAKPYTFAPLYGGMGASEPPHVQKYFEEFFVIYKGMKAQQTLWCESAMNTGIVQIPSGRQYRFRGVRRIRGGRFTKQTNIVNYPVQGFATGDIVPLACIRAFRRFRELGLKSKLVLTVHDSIVVDVYPGELEEVKLALCWAMREVPEEMKSRWGYDCVLPLAIEIEAGPTWMSMEELDLPPVANKSTFDDDLDDLFAA